MEARAGRVPWTAAAGWALGWVWALPVTLLGYVLGLPLARVVRITRGGVVHFAARPRGLMQWAMRRLHVSAYTLGTTVTHLEPQGPWDERLLCHEDAHVVQTLVLGPLFLPVYFAASGWAALRGRDAYRDNWFEVRARLAEEAAQRGLRVVR